MKTKSEITDRPVFVKTKETIAATAAMRGTTVGRTITWLELSEAIQDDAQDHVSSITSARRELLKEGIVFASVRGVGYKRLDDAGIVAGENDACKRIGRSARRSLKRLAVVTPENLDPHERTQYAVASAIAGAVAVCTGGRQRNLLEQTVVRNDSAKLDIGDTLRLFGG